jgi:hypothetical protein
MHWATVEEIFEMDNKRYDSIIPSFGIRPMNREVDMTSDEKWKKGGKLHDITLKLVAALEEMETEKEFTNEEICKLADVKIKKRKIYDYMLAARKELIKRGFEFKHRKTKDGTFWRVTKNENSIQ